MSIDTKFVKGADKLSQRIRTIRTALSLPPMVAEIGNLLERRTLARFDRMVDPDEKPWKPLADTTWERRQSEGIFHRRMLVRSENLRSSIRVVKGGAGSTFTNTGAGVRIGIDASAKGKRGPVAVYAGVHQRGNPKHNTPARRFLGVGRLDVKAVDSFLRRKGQEAVE